MSDQETTTSDAPKTNWLPIIKDMFILVCIMATIGYLCKLAMMPFEYTSPTDSLVSLVRKGAVVNGSDPTYLQELEDGQKNNPDFINSVDNTGRTPLMWAAYCNFNNTSKSLEKDLQRLYYVRSILGVPGVKSKAVDQDGFTALHWAAWSGMPHTTVLLLNAGLDINAVDNRGFTPLMLAAMRGNAEVVKVLLSLGAKMDAVNADGQTAAQLVHENEGAYGKREALIFSWTGIPKLKDFNLFELIYAPARESAYLGTIKLFDNPPAPQTIEELMKAVEAAESAAATQQSAAK